MLNSREKKGYENGHEKAYAEGLSALVNTLSNFLPDIESVYQTVISQDIYSQVSKEQIEECYNQIMTDSKNNSANI